MKKHTHTHTSSEDPCTPADQANLVAVALLPPPPPSQAPPRPLLGGQPTGTPSNHPTEQPHIQRMPMAAPRDLSIALAGAVVGGAAAMAVSSCLRGGGSSSSGGGGARLRAAFVMQLNDEKYLGEYCKRHDGTDPYWDGPKAQLHHALSSQGVHNYSIFHSPATNQLFAYAETDDQESFKRVSEGRDCALWWKYFEDWGGMKYNDDKGTTMLGGCTPWAEGLNEVFHMR